MRRVCFCALLALAVVLTSAAGCALNVGGKRNIKENENAAGAERAALEAAEPERGSDEPLRPEKNSGPEKDGAAAEAAEQVAQAAEDAAESGGEPPEAPAEPEVIAPPPVIHAEPAEPGSDSDFVRVKDYIPDIEVLLMYATDGNFTGRVIYDFTEAYLRYGTVKKLAAAQEVLKEKGYRLLIWDAFRPVSAQFALWAVCPDSTYVANPNTGYSSHSRGNTVDVTVVTLDGGEVEMPTGFDDFSALADRNYSDCTDSAAANARMLENVMIAAGFKPYSGEWWHFSDNVSYGVEQSFEPPSESAEG